jgi:hypothetical protein
MAGAIMIQVGKWGELGTVAEETLRRLSDATHRQAINELDHFFGGGHWLKNYDGTVATQGGIVTYTLQIKEPSVLDPMEMTKKIQEVFNRHWATAIQAYRSESIVAAPSQQHTSERTSIGEKRKKIVKEAKALSRQIDLAMLEYRVHENAARMKEIKADIARLGALTRELEDINRIRGRLHGRQIRVGVGILLLIILGIIVVRAFVK